MESRRPVWSTAFRACDLAQTTEADSQYSEEDTGEGKHEVRA